MKHWLIMAMLVLLSPLSWANSADLFQIKGVKLGQMSDDEGLTGITVLRFDAGATASVDVRGAAPGTRETDLLKPENLVDKVHAIVLTGGSAFGLDAMSGVAHQLEKEGIGFDTGVAFVPIVTGAVLFDLGLGDAKSRPDFAMGAAATRAANRESAQQGNVGAGTGASVGKIRGMAHATKAGLGIATLALDNGLVVSAVVAVNAWGDVYDRQGQILAGTRNDEGTGYVSGTELIIQGAAEPGFVGRNTTIGAIITNATLTKSEALKVAQMAHDGYGRAIRPVHTLNDGDAIFAAGTGEIGPVNVNSLGVIAAEVMEQAIHNAIEQAEGAGGLPAARDLIKVETQ
ncbi:P1 family peptidase [Ferrimonas marina]|uniref:L-aminopeptidase/D-esterase n=1 Tax=Ferrimonas marina TaxID=299255 RepID=A0A1M5ZAZ5_9GAMM|nr:P1 family peptidase [Ferrimonas marina]SHI21352.1 L-aminopeptidase/D-esterase [Ferrimonas marina]